MDPSPRGFDFEGEWASLRRYLHALLSRRRVPLRLQEDLIQETGARLWMFRSQIDPIRGPEGLATTIVMNLLRDHLRQERRLLTDSDLTSLPGSQDIANEVVARDEWQRVGKAIARLSPQHREVLIADLDEERVVGRRTPAAVRMMKMRARKQLRSLMQEVSRAKAGCGLAIHRCWDSLVTRFGITSPRAEHAAQLASAAVVLATVTIGSLTYPSTRSLDMATVAPPRSSQPAVGASDTALAATAGSSDQTLIPVRGLQIAERPERDKRRVFTTVLRLGPIWYSSGRSLTSASVEVDTKSVPRLDAIVRSPSLKPICRVGLLGRCKGASRS